MKRILTIVVIALLAGGAVSGQTKGAKAAPTPSTLTKFGFTDAEAKTAQDDFKAWDQAQKARDAQRKVYDAQASQLLLQDAPDRAAFETLMRAIGDLEIAQNLAQFDLLMKWRATYGKDKAKTLAQILAGAQGAGGSPAARMQGKM